VGRPGLGILFRWRVDGVLRAAIRAFARDGMAAAFGVEISDGFETVNGGMSMLVRKLGMIAAMTAGLAGNAGCEKTGAAEQAKENAAAGDNLTVQRHAAEESASAQADMNERVNAAQAQFESAREDYRGQREKDLADVDAKMTDLESTARKATSVTRERLEQSLSGLRAQRTALASDVRNIGLTTAAAWDDFKARVDNEFNSLKTALSKAS
jgi:hypothetical protein